VLLRLRSNESYEKTQLVSAARRLPVAHLLYGSSHCFSASQRGPLFDPLCQPGLSALLNNHGGHYIAFAQLKAERNAVVGEVFCFRFWQHLGFVSPGPCAQSRPSSAVIVILAPLSSS
jgi:hypothetical protein